MHSNTLNTNPGARKQNRPGPVDNDKTRPVMSAESAGHAGVTQLLLAAGEEVDDGDLLRAIMSGSEDTMLVCCGAQGGSPGSRTQTTRATSIALQAA